MTVSVALGLAVATGGCASASATPGRTPADFEGVTAELDRAHIAVSHVVSGDPGCDDPSLAPTAIGFDAQGLDQPEAVRVHLFLFRDGPTYDRLRPTVDRCAAAVVSDPNAYVALDARPFVATAAGPWGADFRAAFRAALTRAAGG
jgi:hypothetical protein